MTDSWTALLTMVGTILAAGLGLLVRRLVKADTLDKGTRNVIQVSAVFILTFSSVVLGIVLAQSSARYVERKNQIDDIAAHISVLDQMLRIYDPQKQELRQELRSITIDVADLIWDMGGTMPRKEREMRSARILDFYEKIVHLPVDNEMKAGLKSSILESVHDIGRLRQVLLSEAADQSIGVMTAGCIFWFLLNFLFYFILAPVNRVAIIVLALCSLAITFFAYIIEEQDNIDSGFIHISPTQILNVLPPLERARQ